MIIHKWCASYILSQGTVKCPVVPVGSTEYIEGNVCGRYKKDGVLMYLDFH